MTLSLQLDNPSLFKVARRASQRSKRIREKLVQRTTGGKQFAVWEVPYGQPDAIKAFIEGLKETFPPEVMQETLLFVNNGNGGAHQCYVAAGFPEVVFPHVQQVLNELVGVTRTFQIAPELLVALAVQGIFEMETKLTAAKVDRAYGGKPSPQV